MYQGKKPEWKCRQWSLASFQAGKPVPTYCGNRFFYGIWIVAPFSAWLESPPPNRKKPLFRRCGDDYGKMLRCQFYSRTRCRWRNRSFLCLYWGDFLSECMCAFGRLFEQNRPFDGTSLKVINGTHTQRAICCFYLCGPSFGSEYFNIICCH